MSPRKACRQTLCDLVGCALIVFIAVMPATAEPLQRLGGEFQVNTLTTGFQRYFDVDAAPDGSFVVVWTSDVSAGDDDAHKSIQMQRYDSTGAPIGSQAQVNTLTSGNERRADVAVQPNGDFVVAWEGDGFFAGTFYSVHVQRFDSTGLAKGEEFRVYPQGLGIDEEYEPSIAATASGDFVVAWQQSSGNKIYARRFDSSGQPETERLVVKDVFGLGVQYPSVAPIAGDGFVVVWQNSTLGLDGAIEGRRYDSNGSAIGGAFVISDLSDEEQRWPEVAARPGGGFTVAWSSESELQPDIDYLAVRARVYDEDGDPVASAFQVNTTTTDGQYLPDLTTNAAGETLIAWRSWSSAGADTSDRSVLAQLYDTEMQPVGAEFEVNAYTTGGQITPRLASAGDRFVVAWQSFGSPETDTDRDSIQASIWIGPLFQDGFESGDLSAWSASSRSRR